MKLLLGKMEEQLKHLEDNSVDSIVTDPPYGIDFMGKKWDYQVPSVEQWQEALRVLKPGGHLISFSSARTYHRMAVLVEDAGFEIRDQIMWVYGSGFPKSLNVGKRWLKREFGDIDFTIDWDVDWIEVEEGFKHPETGLLYQAVPDMRGTKVTSIGGTIDRPIIYSLLDVPTSPYDGLGTALKPSHEPMVLARKPLSEKTVLANVEQWGVGAINIDATRVAADGEDIVYHSVGETGNFAGREGKETVSDKDYHTRTDGRWPANFIHDGSQEVLDLFPDSSGGHWPDSKTTGGGKSWGGKSEYKGTGPKDKGDGSAARFFYVPKVSKKDRNEGLDHLPDKEFVNTIAQPERAKRPFYPQKNTHPTVKPTDLMHYLIRMVTPAGGTVLDPFMGSGSTGKAAIRNGYNFIGIEMEEDSFNVAKARIEYERNYHLTASTGPEDEDRGRVRIL